MASLANKDEAEKCRDMAKGFLARGEREKAVRFFEKSLRLYPLPDVEKMRDAAKVRSNMPPVMLCTAYGITGTCLESRVDFKLKKR